MTLYKSWVLRFDAKASGYEELRTDDNHVVASLPI